MKIRFQVDADLNQAIVTGIRRHEPATDFLTANVTELSSLNDLEVLGIAANLTISVADVEH
jgi:hypothetical protein